MTGRPTLRPCASRWCVSTQAPLTLPLRRIEPIRFAGDGTDAMRAVLAVLARIPRLRVLERDDRRVHAVVASRILRVPLDLEIIVDPERGRVDLRAYRPFAILERSQSRVRGTGLLRLIEDEIRWAG